MTDDKAAWAAEWAAIKRRAAAGDEEAQMIVELDKRAGRGDKVAGDMLYFSEVLKLSRRLPPDKRLKFITETMQEILIRHGQITSN